jgi:hypothetical protein
MGWHPNKGWQKPEETHSSRAGETWREMRVNFAFEASLFISVGSAIFLNKIGSGTHSDPKFGRRGGGVSYIDDRKEGFGTLSRFASFWERTSGTASRRVPSQKHPCLYGPLTCRKILRHGTKTLFPLQRKRRYGLLSALQIHRPRLVFNPRTVGPITSTLRTRPPRVTILGKCMVESNMYLYNISFTFCVIENNVRYGN